MQKKCKAGCKKCKGSYGNILEGCKGISPWTATFYKHNSDFFNKLCKHASRNMTDYYKTCYKRHAKVFKKPGVTNKYADGNIKNNMDVLQASGHDICNYLVQHGMADLQIQAIMKLDGRFDFDILKRAVRLSVDAEPVLGCRFVEDDPPYWKRFDNIDEITFCSLEETNNTDEAVMRFLQSPLDMNNDTNVKVKVIRSKQYDILGVKLNHACCDGTSAKDYIQLLSGIYSSIDQEDGTFIPDPIVSSRKDQDRLFEELDTTCPELKWNPMMGTPKTMWSFPWTQRAEDSICFSVCKLPQGGLESIYRYGKLRGATVNDLILTAFYRAMLKISKPTNGMPMDISSTIDLRRYMPDHKTQALRNLSGGFVTRIASMSNEPFDATLFRVLRATEKIKGKYPDVNSSMGGEYVEKTISAFSHNYFDLISQTSGIAAQYPAYVRNICFPGLSNLGYISNSLIRFGKNVVSDAYIMPPVMRAPGFLLLVSSYNGVLTLSVGYYKASVSQREMDGLLNKIKSELLRSC